MPKQWVRAPGVILVRMFLVIFSCHSLLLSRAGLVAAARRSSANARLQRERFEFFSRCYASPPTLLGALYPTHLHLVSI
ncbi:hypothetical protein B0H16DRAFT_1548189 [Mycena metata]|uniref:Uncharacterized protein n=1 Tax=Mycena metata TaxID=1033252 RepID=A0AAD7IVQ0_9AGAR|nr:hypothetical protein B0H16DRAFT_1548189 [Mycena metata]